MKLDRQSQLNAISKTNRWLAPWMVITAGLLLVWGVQASGSLNSSEYDSKGDSDRAIAASQSITAETQDMFNLSSLHSFAEGSWVVSESPWEFQSQQVSQRQFERLISDTPRGLADLHGSTQQEHRVVLDLFPASKAKTRVDGQLAWRTVELGTVRACVCYRPEENSIIHLIVAHQMHDDQWHMIRLIPNRRRPSEHEHLLPMIEDCNSQCRRLGNRGQLQCEIVEIHCDRNELLSFWRQAGWFMQEEVHADNCGWICHRGSQTVRVQPLADSGDSNTRLILTALHQHDRK